MNSDNKLPLKEIREFQSKYAGEQLLPSFAKLYSQHTRLNYQQSGLSGWNGETEFNNRLDDAIKLINAGIYDKETNGNNWRGTLRRAGEILEWLSHVEMNLNEYPLRFLSAAAYQLAGYPALATGLLNQIEINNESDILRAFLGANFPQLDVSMQQYWVETIEEAKLDFIGPILEENIMVELIRSLGILNMYMRWGEESRINIAQNKLKAISKLHIHHRDPLSWILSKLCSEIFQEYINNSLRHHVNGLKPLVNQEGNKALEKYIRNSYLGCKSLVWFSQIKGIEQLIDNDSFALCTPTGTGKTTIAELAIIMSLFKPKSIDLGEDSKWLADFMEDIMPSAIAIYLVPSRALATEVEIKLNLVFKNISEKPVIVTGLYGGIDWGPTDSWITSNDRTVLICTYEKAEALIRFLGPLFLSRVSLVVIDEAHSLQFDGRYESLATSDNRTLRLETLSNRLIVHLDKNKSKIIALSAVAAGGSDTLARWVSGNPDAKAETTSYRSTRQLIGRLEWSKSGEYKILYDLMNGTTLKFEKKLDDENVPFIPKPFAPFPKKFSEIPKKFINKGPSKKSRPFLYWAAIEIAKIDLNGNQNSVLISITQNISGYAQDFLYTLETIFKKIEVTQFFVEPQEKEKLALWRKCLRSCEDYFGEDSVEYKLLKKGIAVHYGNMPGLTARLLVEVINKKIVVIVLATSTLSEGINLPFETVLIPTLKRMQEVLSLKEFSNLVGRAGRPGIGTEGKALVFLEDSPSTWSDEQPILDYNSILDQINSTKTVSSTSKSPLAELLGELENKWKIAFNSDNKDQFLKWLEDTVPLNNEEYFSNSYSSEELLDTLDGILIPIIVELELIDEQETSFIELEEKLKEVWRKSYSYYAATEKEYLERIFLRRGVAIPNKIYPDYEIRRKIYRTSLSPRYAKELIILFPDIVKQLSYGVSYHGWDMEKKFDYIMETAKLLFSLKKFNVKESVGRGGNLKSMAEILRWWSDPDQVQIKPKSNELSLWVKYINTTFTYQFNWGIGTVISLVLDEIHDGRIIPTRLEDWSNSGLPWIVFWLKEMITWGTMDPVAALLLAQGVCYTRKEALELAKEYYEQYEFTLEVDGDIYDAVVIREWVTLQRDIIIKDNINTEDILVNLSRDFNDNPQTEWRVNPIQKEGKIIWMDHAGYELASSSITQNGFISNDKSDYILNYKKMLVKVVSYIE